MEGIIQGMLYCKLNSRKWYLEVRVIAACHLITRCHNTESILGGVGKEAEPIQLVLEFSLELVITQRGGVTVTGVKLKVAKEGSLLSLGVLDVLLLECLLAHLPSLDLCLSKVHSCLTLPLPKSTLPLILG